MSQKLSRNLVKLKTNMMKNRKHVGDILSRIKYGVDKSISIKEVVSAIYNKQLPGTDFVFQGLKISSLEDLGITRYIPYNESSSFFTEINWAFEVIQYYTEDLKKFLMLKKRIEFEILTGQYPNALSTLDEIELITKSVWSVEIRFLIIQLSEGFEENRKLLSEIVDLNKLNFMQILFDFISFKSDVDTSYSSLEYRLEKFLEYFYQESHSYNVLKLFLQHRLLVHSFNYGSKDLACIMSIEGTMSIVDYYNALVECIAISITNELIDCDELIEIRSKIQILNETLDDTKLDNIFCYLSNGKDIEHNIARIPKTMCLLVDSYTMGAYSKCNTIFNESIDQLGTSFEAIEIYAKSVTLSTIDNNSLYLDNEVSDVIDNTLLLSLVDTMKNITACVDRKDNLIKALDIAKLVMSLDLRYGIIAYIEDNILPHRTERVNRLFSLFNTQHFTPRMIFHFNDIYIDDIVSELERFQLYPMTNKLIRNYSNSDIRSMDDLPVLRTLYYEAKSFVGRNNEEAIKKFEILHEMVNCAQTNEERYYYERTSRELFYEYIELGDINCAINVLVEAFLIDDGFSMRMNPEDLKKLVDNLNDLEQEKLFLNIKWPIFNYILKEKDYSNLYICLFNYLESNGYNDNLEFLNFDYIANNVNKKEYVFVLNRICVYEVVKRNPFFDFNNRYNTRIKTLQKLLDIDIENKTVYEKELRQTFYEQGISEKAKTIDKEKIFVDVKGIILENEVSFREKFAKYTTIKNMNVNLSSADIYGIADISSTAKRVFKEKEGHQKITLLKEIYLEFSNEFLFNPNYGLEKYLSTRIRHGLMDSFLLKAFTNLYLLSTHEEENTESLNIYWDQRFIEDAVSSDEKKFVIDLVKDFTSDILGKVQEAKDWVKVKSKDNPTGVFSFDEYLNDTNTMSQFNETIESFIDFEMFYQRIAEHFWLMTEIGLNQIRLKLESEVKTFFFSKLDDLESSIDNSKRLFDSVLIRDIQNKIISCKPRVRGDIDEVKNWFYIRKGVESYDYTMSELFEIVKKTHNKLNHQFEKVSVRMECDGTQLKGKSFVYMWDIINILYSNSLIHSGCENFGDLNVCLSSTTITNLEFMESYCTNLESAHLYEKVIQSLKESNEILHFRIENTLSKDLVIDDVMLSIHTKINNLRNTEEYKKMVLREGGSGLAKLNSILQSLEGPSLFYYTFTETTILFSMFLSKEYYLAEQEDFKIENSNS